MKSFLSLLCERREMRASKNAILGLGVGSKPGPLAPNACGLPMRNSTSFWDLHAYIIFFLFATIFYLILE